MTLHGTVSYGTYLQLDVVKSWLGIATSDTTNDANLQILVDAACDECQRYCNRPVTATEFTRAFDGGSGLQGSWIILPFFPVLQVLSVIEYHGNNAVTLTEVNPSSGGDGFRVHNPTGRINRVIGGVYPRPWIPSELGVFVTWIAGFEPVPASLRMATLDLIKYWWVQTQAYGNTGSANPYSDENAANGLWPGLPNRIKTALDPFVVGSIG